MMRQRITEKSRVHEGWYKEAKETTVDTLPSFIHKLTNEYIHDCGTICHAVAAGMLAAGHAINHSPQGGITGFQASAVMWEFMNAWAQVEGPMRLLQYEDLLYPYYQDKFATIPPGVWNWLIDKAREKLEAASEDAHPDVVAHWKSIVDGCIPFGLAIEMKEE